ncbi:MAG: aminopeptidase P N-terminal domain-containing protein [Planctomycetota bacterium]|jgi:Xaa-Pro aminopeptidase
MSFLECRRARVAKAWALQDEVVLLPAGDPIPIPGTDEFYRFRAHPDHRYLANTNEPGRVLAYDARDDEWILFAPRVPADEIVWHGHVEEVGRPLSELDSFLEGRTVIETPTHAIEVARRIKDDEELRRMRRAAAATAAGIDEATMVLRPGMTELQVEAELEVGFLRAGATRAAYDSIVATGRNAAVLHHSPNDTVIGENEFVLIDAGGAYDGYSCDCTRTLCAGDMSKDQKAIYDIVLNAQIDAIGRCRKDVEFVDIHQDTARAMAQGLVDFGLLRGDASGLVESGAMSLFFPHGLGHLIGLGTHDPAGYADGRTRSEHRGLRYLRADLPLEPGMVITVEPGIYFIETLLRDPELRAEFGDSVDWAKAESLLPLGGVRIEDNVHITEDYPEVLTSGIPK